MPLTLAAAVRSHVGLVRDHNEDAVFASPRMVAVADGVGGHAAGEVASATLINAVAHLDKVLQEDELPEALPRAIKEGNEALAMIAERRPQTAGMATTLTAVGLHEDAFVVANIGDSRTYLLRDGDLAQLTRDDSYVQELIDSGHLEPEEARDHPYRSVVLRALDGQTEAQVTVEPLPAHEGDRLLLCSDGLSDLVEDAEIADALKLDDRDEAADRLVALALEAGGRDNISVIVADVAQD